VWQTVRITKCACKYKRGECWMGKSVDLWMLRCCKAHVHRYSAALNIHLDFELRVCVCVCAVLSIYVPVN